MDTIIALLGLAISFLVFIITFTIDSDSAVAYIKILDQIRLVPLVMK